MHTVQLIFKKSSKPNQTNAATVGSVCAVYRDIKNMIILPTYYKKNNRKS
jgi:hypothetical protein